MKTLIIVLCLISTPVFAATKAELCSSVSEAAEVIMQNHQNGTPMAKMMELSKGNNVIDSMIIDAYGRARYATAAMKQRQVDRFRDECYLTCLRAVKDNNGGN